MCCWRCAKLVMALSQALVLAAKSRGQRARIASAIIIPNFDRALHTLITHLICARLRDW